MLGVESTLSRLVTTNNERIRAYERSAGIDPVRPTQTLDWAAEARAKAPAIRAEWSDAVARGYRLPLIEDVIAEDQENDGPWRAGLLVAYGKPVAGIADVFPTAVAAALAIPSIMSALWSVLEPGTELPEHVGHNAGVLRYHLGIDCGVASALIVGDRVIRYRDDHDVLFDDTHPHAASNRGERSRITLFCELRKPLPPRLDARNRIVQKVLSQDRRYRLAAARATEWHAIHNARL